MIPGIVRRAFLNWAAFDVSGVSCHLISGALMDRWMLNMALFGCFSMA